MSTQAVGQATVFGRYMKQWRRQRGFSQLDLAVQANVSQRHLSFIETGRSRPREDVVLKVAEALSIPLRDRNILLEAAGLSSNYPEVSLSDEEAAPFYSAVRQMIKSHEPYPAFVVNHWWELVDANGPGRKIFPQLQDEPIDLVDAFLGPGQMRENIDNFTASGSMFLRRLRREIAESGPDERLQEVLERAEAYMKDIAVEYDNLGSDLLICPHFRFGDKVIRTVSMVARFGTAREVTLDELRVELMFPRDDEAEAFFRQGF